MKNMYATTQDNKTAQSVYKTDVDYTKQEKIWLDMGYTDIRKERGVVLGERHTVGQKK